MLSPPAAAVCSRSRRWRPDAVRRLEAAHRRRATGAASRRRARGPGSLRHATRNVSCVTSSASGRCRRARGPASTPVARRRGRACGTRLRCHSRPAPRASRHPSPPLDHASSLPPQHASTGLSGCASLRSTIVSHRVSVSQAGGTSRTSAFAHLRLIAASWKSNPILHPVRMDSRELRAFRRRADFSARPPCCLGENSHRTCTQRQEGEPRSRRPQSTSVRGCTRRRRRRRRSPPPRSKQRPRPRSQRRRAPARSGRTRQPKQGMRPRRRRRPPAKKPHIGDRARRLTAKKTPAAAKQRFGRREDGGSSPRANSAHSASPVGSLPHATSPRARPLLRTHRRRSPSAHAGRDSRCRRRFPSRSAPRECASRVPRAGCPHAAPIPLLRRRLLASPLTHRVAPPTMPEPVRAALVGVSQPNDH